MKISRLDLDGTGSPEGLVAKILKAEPGLTYPVPIEELAAALDIKEIAELQIKEFEGSLLMDANRSAGIILVNKGARDGRRRFTIGHELGHFCIPTHKPVKGDHFLCSRDDMRLWSTSEQSAYARMEVEANKFSALLLMPPPLLRTYLAGRGDPDLSHAIAIHEDFVVSKDAAARAYAQYHNEPIAIAVVHEGRVQRIYRHIKFPRMSVAQGEEVPPLVDLLAGSRRSGADRDWRDPCRPMARVGLGKEAARSLRASALSAVRLRPDYAVAGICRRRGRRRSR